LAAVSGVEPQPGDTDFSVVVAGRVGHALRAADAAQRTRWLAAIQGAVDARAALAR
jgi:hypothetical protein